MHRFHPDIFLLAREYRALCHERGSQQDLVHNPMVAQGEPKLREACFFQMRFSTTMMGVGISTRRVSFGMFGPSAYLYVSPTRFSNLLAPLLGKETGEGADAISPEIYVRSFDPSRRWTKHAKAKGYSPMHGCVHARHNRVSLPTSLDRQITR